MKKIAFAVIIIFFMAQYAHAAPCYGTKMPKKNKFFIGLESYSLFKRYLENNQGKVRSQQQFLDVSYGIFDWLSLDLKGGIGNIKQRPVDSSEVDYSFSFAGGYGLRFKFFDKNKIKLVFGFQHISVHPKHTYVSDVKNRAILDDWQTSLLASYEFKRITPYLGARWSRVDYIHWIGDNRKRIMSSMTRDIGLIYGFTIPITQKTWLNLEGSAFDSDALAVSINHSF